MLSFWPQVTWRYVVVQQTVEIGWLFESSHVECDESDLEYNSNQYCSSCQRYTTPFDTFVVMQGMISYLVWLHQMDEWLHQQSSRRISRAYWSMKKSIWIFRRFASSLLNPFSEEAVTAHSDKAFHLPTPTRSLKKYFLTSRVDRGLNNFILCPRVFRYESKTNRDLRDGEDNPLKILYTSIKSALFLLSSSNHNPSFPSLSS